VIAPQSPTEHNRREGAKVDTRPWEKAEIAERFKALRWEALLTQEHLARLIGADRKTICRIESLRSMPRPRTWRRFAQLEARHNQPKVELPEHWIEE